MPIQLLQENPLTFFAWVSAVVLGITFHEFSHVLAAYLQGDNTGKDLGRLTLNPLAHIDPVGLILLVVAGFGWGRPAPYNPYNLKNPRVGSILVAAAGPISNLVLIVFFGLIFHFLLPLLHLPPENLFVVFLVFLIQVNIILMVFNLLPLPPLDGSGVVLNALPESLAPLRQFLQRYGFILLLMFILAGGSLLTPIFSYFLNLAARIIG